MTSLMFTQLRKFSASSFRPKCHVCIIGAGPAGFYAAQHIAKVLKEAKIDILDKLPVPFGLVRFGVAPDHPEVKNVISTFTKTANNQNVSFYGNVTLGKDVTLSQLRENYHAVLLSYGAEADRRLGIPNEDNQNVISARRFVGWYNGVPGDEHLHVDLTGSTVSVLGQGNVAMDVARILLTPLDILRKTDITEHALTLLAQSRVKNVHLIGRRGPLQAAFTIKELREQIKLRGCATVWRKTDFENIHSEIVKDLPRPRKRITELMLKSLSEMETQQSTNHKFFPIFCRSPLKFLISDNQKLKGIELAINKLEGDTCVHTEQREILNCNMALRSIGYRSVPADSDINFDLINGLVFNKNGRVIISSKKQGKQIDDVSVDPGLYVTGWLQTGPVGVILSTMSNAFEVGENICRDIQSNFIDCEEKKNGYEGLKTILDGKNVAVVNWNGWERIDSYEIEQGKKLGKPREKIICIKKMIEIGS